MKKLNNKTGLALAVLCVLHCYEVKADYPKEVEISGKNKQINVGQPLILRLTYKFDQSQLSVKSGDPLILMSPEANVQVKKNGEVIFNPGYWYLGQYDLNPQDNKGLTYSGNFLLFYDLFKKRLIFDTPGKYTIVIRITREMISKPLEITVKPASQSEKKVLSVLSDSNAYIFLLRGGDKYLAKRPKRISQLKDVIDRFEDNVLAQMGAAQLGLEYFKEFQDKHPIFIFYEEQHQRDLINGQLFNQAHKYLAIGTKLPDDFPIREKVLKELVSAEYIRGNNEKALLLIDELGTKYPKGKYGRKASKWKEELLELQKRELK